LEASSFKKINLNVDEIVKYVNNSNKSNDSNDKKKVKSINPDDLYKKQLDYQNDLSINYEDMKIKKIERQKFDDFTEKYLGNLTLTEIKKMIEENSDKKQNMNDYYNQLINCANTNEDYYSNSKLMAKLLESKNSEEVLYYYQSDFQKIIDFIENIITNLQNNLYLLPYSVKCLCKIIYILIEKKFPSINSIQRNAFIADFLFKQLLIPILENPGVGVLINNFIISRNTLSNIKTINKILIQFVSGKLFEDTQDNYFTPFNWYFLEKMPDIINIFEKITKVTLPHFIEDLLNDRLKDDFQYDYFRENPDEVMFHRSICFNLHDIKAILDNIEKCQDKIFEDNA
jgi:hypothetical protein